MSGYNNRTGRYELTATKAEYWWRHSKTKPKTMEEFAIFLEGSGIKVFAVHETWIECENYPAAIWTALSGKPSRRPARLSAVR
jgi:hypothetical protein